MAPASEINKCPAVLQGRMEVYGLDDEKTYYTEIFCRRSPWEIFEGFPQSYPMKSSEGSTVRRQINDER